MKSIKLSRSLSDAQIHEEEINQRFHSLIADMTDKQFWNWVSTWKDQSEIVDEALNWDTETKEQALREFKQLTKTKKK